MALERLEQGLSTADRAGSLTTHLKNPNSHNRGFRIVIFTAKACGVVKDFSKQHSILNKFVAELRDKNVQQDSLRFRRNLERIGEIFALEISKTLNYEEAEIDSPLGLAKAHLPVDQIVLGTILRAGLPLHQGLLNYFDDAENAFVSAYRRYTNANDFEIEVEYMASPDLEGKVLILADPMIATGHSIQLVYESLAKLGSPAQLHVVSAISSVQGVNHLSNCLPEGTVIWSGAIDANLSAKAYILPGLGDAGDLAYGLKN